MHGWLLDVIRCPLCGGKLAAKLGSGRAPAGVLVCKKCKAPMPVLAGVPLAVSDPALYCARHREAIVTTLAEMGAATKDNMAVLDTCTAQAPKVEPARFTDDWVAQEIDMAEPAVSFDAKEGATKMLGDLVAEAERSGPAQVSLEMLRRAGAESGTTLELGVGAGPQSESLAKLCEQLVVADLSLRAAMRAQRRAGKKAAAVVLDAEALSPTIAGSSLRAIVALNLVDLLEAPDLFLEDAVRTLSRTGRLVISTPDPALRGRGGAGDGRALDILLEESKLRIVEDVDAVPWTRVHGPRHVEIYLTRVLACRRA